jgi:TATA-box binding protein (TBP) (component of TFIID and TFIIIB)
MAKVSIVNVVATAGLGQEVDLDDLGKHREILHDPEIYGGRVAYFSSPNTKGKVSIFLSGKMMSVGTRSEAEAFRALECAKDFLVEKGYVKPIAFVKLIQNIVAVADFEENVNLERLAQDYKVIYEPEQFPGGIFRMEEPIKVTVLIYASGKAVIAGLKSSKDIEPLVQKLENVIKAYA